MSEHELRVCYGLIYQMISRERRTREAALSNSPILKQKLAECDTAMLALTTMKDELKRFVTAGPVQEMLVDVPESNRQTGED